MRLSFGLTLAVLIVAGAASSGCATATDLVRTAQQVGGVAQTTGMAPVSVYWNTSAGSLARNVGDTIVADCPPNGEPSTVWGSDVYTDDSSICTAAVHMGLLTFRSGGRVTVQIRPGQDRYAGVERNGVRSSVYGRWGKSFVFVR